MYSSSCLWRQDIKKLEAAGAGCCFAYSNPDTVIAKQIKADDQLEWVRHMNSIKNRAEEIVLSELVYC